jgi:hypothetical protein
VRFKKLDAALEHQDAQDQHGRERAAKMGFDAALKAAKDSDIDKLATKRAAEMRMAGGYQDKFGRFLPMTPESQSKHLQRMIGEELQRRFPAMGGMQRSGVAAILGVEANKQVEQQMNAAAAQAAVQGGNRTVAQVQALQGMVASLNERIKQMERGGRMLAQGVEETRQRMPSMMSNGY